MAIIVRYELELFGLIEEHVAEMVIWRRGSSLNQAWHEERSIVGKMTGYARHVLKEEQSSLYIVYCGLGSPEGY